MEERYLLCKNKDRKEAITILSISLIVLVVCVTLIAMNPFDGAIPMSGLILVFDTLALITGLSLLSESSNDANYFPKYKLGDVVIVSKTSTSGKKDYEFSQYDDIINQIPQYLIKEIGECSYLLSPKDHNGEVKEVKFRHHSSIFSIPEFKEKAKCCD